jgi:hypothetical protein
LSFVESDSFYKKEHPCSTVFLSANKYVRKMKGGSQAILVQCDDDRFYIVKMGGNPQGPNVMANEFLGSVIAGAVGLPVAESMAIHLSDHFIDSEPDICFEHIGDISIPPHGKRGVVSTMRTALCHS